MRIIWRMSMEITMLVVILVIISIKVILRRLIIILSRIWTGCIICIIIVLKMIVIINREIWIGISIYLWRDICGLKRVIGLEGIIRVETLVGLVIVIVRLERVWIRVIRMVLVEKIVRLVGIRIINLIIVLLRIYFIFWEIVCRMRFRTVLGIVLIGS